MGGGWRIPRVPDISNSNSNDNSCRSRCTTPLNLRQEDAGGDAGIFYRRDTKGFGRVCKESLYLRSRFGLETFTGTPEGSDSSRRWVGGVEDLTDTKVVVGELRSGYVSVTYNSCLYSPLVMFYLVFDPWTLLTPYLLWRGGRGFRGFYVYTESHGPVHGTVGYPESFSRSRPRR